MSSASIALALLVELSVLMPLFAKAAENLFSTSPFITGITITDLTTGKQLCTGDSVARKNG